MLEACIWAWALGILPIFGLLAVWAGHESTKDPYYCPNYSMCLALGCIWPLVLLAFCASFVWLLVAELYSRIRK